MLPRSAVVAKTLSVKAHGEVVMMPAYIDESIQIACALLPLLSLLWNLSCRTVHFAQRLSRASSSDVEGGFNREKQREKDRKEEESIKKRASAKALAS